MKTTEFVSNYCLGPLITAVVLLLFSHSILSQSEIEIESDTHIGLPHLRLTEIGQDFSRIKMQNTAHASKYWDLAGLAASDDLARFNFYYHDGNVGRDRFTIMGNGKVGINAPFPLIEMDVRTLSTNDGAEMGVGVNDLSYFTRLFSGRDDIPNSLLYWKNNTPLAFGTAEPDGTAYSEFMRIGTGGEVTINNLSGSGERPVVADASGTLRAQNTVAFSASIVSHMIIDFSGDTLVTYNNTWFDPSSNFNSVTGKFTAPSVGIYMIGMRGSWGKHLSDLMDNNVTINFLKDTNGTISTLCVSQFTVNVDDNWGEHTIHTCLVPLNEGDKVFVRASSRNVILLSGGSSTFYGHRIN